MFNLFEEEKIQKAVSRKAIDIHRIWTVTFERNFSDLSVNVKGRHTFACLK